MWGQYTNPLPADNSGCNDDISQYNYARDYYHQYPDNCVEGSFGAKLDPFLQVPEGATFVVKGAESEKSGYSCFGESAKAGQESLQQVLARLDVQRIWVGVQYHELAV